MMEFLMGLQGRGTFTKFPHYLCLWDSIHTKVHYQRWDWPQQTEFAVERYSIKWKPLVDMAFEA